MRKEARTSRIWRRRLFALWIGASIAVALIFAIGAPVLAMLDNASMFILAPLLPALMIVMLFSGIGWLVVQSQTKPSSVRRNVSR